MSTMYQIIEKKQAGEALSEAEIKQFVEGYTAGDIPDYQAAALCMAIYFKGMDYAETALLTRYMANSGDLIDLSAIPGLKVDKHSTGGVGDKATLITVPLAAALGEKVAKFSGRGLGHTGGTLDKLEAIPGFNVSLPIDEFVRIVNEVGAAISGATGDIAPADKKLYALRDVTATVASLPLIASSVMSKKLASGADAVVLDVKCGSGAFMKDAASARDLATTMIEIGEYEGRKMAAFITNMDQPLGNQVGNALEVYEAIETLKGNGPADLTELCVAQCAMSLLMTSPTQTAQETAQSTIKAQDSVYNSANIKETAQSTSFAQTSSFEQAKERVRAAIADGSGLAKLREMVIAQGGDVNYIDDTSLLLGQPFSHDVLAQDDGYIQKMDTEKVGIASLLLGAGRQVKTDKIDYLAGITLLKKTGDKVFKGETIAKMYATNRDLFETAEQTYQEAITLSDSFDIDTQIPIIIDTLTGEKIMETNKGEK